MLVALASQILLAVVVLASVPVAVFVAEVLAALFVRQPNSSKTPGVRPSVAILIPAHNESMDILATLKNLKLEKRPGDRILVVADNCSDDTAQVAGSVGVEVVERKDPAHRGKGFALDCGVRHLATQPPEVVVVLDADCSFAPGSLDNLASMCSSKDGPVQALNLMKASRDQPATFQFAEFSWRIKNWIRPLGLRALRLPCQLTGTGMAIPWDLIKSADLATGEIVEDLKLGLELAKKRKAATFCPSAVVISYFPVTQAGRDTQGQRWEQGHLMIFARNGPDMLLNGIINRNLGATVLALDLAVLPIVLLCTIQLGLVLLVALAVSLGASSLSLWIVLSTFTALIGAIGLCWVAYGRDVLSAKQILFSLPRILIEKIALYKLLIAGGRRPPQWVRTDRNRSVPRKDVD